MHTIPYIIMAWLTFIILPRISAFGYSKGDQHLWPQKHKLCAGQLQSPVAISTSRAIPLPLPALEMIGYHDFLPTPQTLTNNGQTVKLTVSKNGILGLPYIFGATLKQGQRYEMEQLHFHWGIKNNRGAEHVLNGVRYPMEMHIVHRNVAYSNLTHALQYEDGVAVIAVFFQLQDHRNELFQALVSKLSDVQWAHTELPINMSITLISLIPANIDVFYTYKGSLTTPPCSEAVTWIVFATPVLISSRQMNAFRILSNGEETLGDNFRRLQDIGQRKIYIRRLYAPFRTKYNSSPLNFTDLSWFWS